MPTASLLQGNLKTVGGLRPIAFIQVGQLDIPGQKPMENVFGNEVNPLKNKEKRF